eukprot:Sspe_Gene.22898::Locus_8795_Transcript_1_1_Confidence_1.000_Length_10103::g.22898::m.22898
MVEVRVRVSVRDGDSDRDSEVVTVAVEVSDGVLDREVVTEAVAVEERVKVAVRPQQTSAKITNSTTGATKAIPPRGRVQCSEATPCPLHPFPSLPSPQPMKYRDC